MKKLHDFVYSSPVLEFVKKCKKYTDLIEEDFPENRQEFVIRLLQVLPGLYSDMINLPANEPLLDAENEKYVTEEMWSGIFQKLSSILGSQNEYLDVPENNEFDKLEVISRELSEDLSDIYQDIRDFTEVFRFGTEEVMNDVLWECRMNFENYWGKKLLRASLNLHKIMLRDEEILEQMDREFDEKAGGREYHADEWFLSRRQHETGEDDELPK